MRVEYTETPIPSKKTNKYRVNYVTLFFHGAGVPFDIPRWVTPYLSAARPAALTTFAAGFFAERPQQFMTI
jgi:hypothetical protein